MVIIMQKKFDVAISYATEQKELADNIYHYLRAQGWKVFFAPECQEILAGRNQREVFFQIFTEGAELVVLLVSKEYIAKKVPMEEANIAISHHNDNGHVIPVYMYGAELPDEMWDKDSRNYYKSENPAKISEVVNNILNGLKNSQGNKPSSNTFAKDNIYIGNNHANNQQIFINSQINGDNSNG